MLPAHSSPDQKIYYHFRIRQRTYLLSGIPEKIIPCQDINQYVLMRVICNALHGYHRQVKRLLRPRLLPKSLHFMDKLLFICRLNSKGFCRIFHFTDIDHIVLSVNEKVNLRTWV